MSPKGSAFLSKGLSEEGFLVTVSGDGEDGLARAREHVHDLIVLDVSIPKRDGWSVITELRKEGSSTPVLF